MINMQGNTAPDYVTLGFEKIDRDLRFLIGCLGETLVELGHHDLAAYLPWATRPLPPVDSGALPAQLGLVYSMAFQLLNMVEENAAASMRAAEFLAARGFTDVSNLAGGIEAWSCEVDPGVPRY